VKFGIAGLRWMPHVIVVMFRELLEHSMFFVVMFGELLEHIMSLL
jgi:hypothetical protein